MARRSLDGSFQVRGFGLPQPDRKLFGGSFEFDFPFDGLGCGTYEISLTMILNLLNPSNENKVVFTLDESFEMTSFVASTTSGLLSYDEESLVFTFDPTSRSLSFSGTLNFSVGDIIFDYPAFTLNPFGAGTSSGTRTAPSGTFPDTIEAQIISYEPCGS
jgi:hypothetical protein